MTRRQSPQWQALRRDVPTFIASAAVYLASVCVIVAFLGLVETSASSPMGQPLFWVLAVPLTIWALALGGYGPRAVAILRSLMIVDAPAVLVILALAYVRGGADRTLFVVTTILTIALTAAGVWFYSQSVLRRDGPLR
jgi:hypothetical protein